MQYQQSDDITKNGKDKRKNLVPIYPEQHEDYQLLIQVSKKENKVLIKEEIQVTEEYQKRAQEVLNIVKKLNIKKLP